MNVIEQIFFGAVGVALLVLTFKLVHKEKYSFAFFVFIVAVVSFLLTATWFQGLMKTGVISTVTSTLKLYGIGNPITTFKNILLHGLVDYDLNQTVYAIQYVKDTRETNLVQKVEYRGENLFLDGAYLPVLRP
jgi:predicted cation transporter